MTPRIVGLDLSLRATGYADEDGARVISCKLRDAPRLVNLRDVILSRVEAALYSWPDDGPPMGKRRADLVVMEDYSGSHAATGATAYLLGELGGVVKVALHELGIAPVLVAAAALKKFATGKGNANKVAMATAASRAGYDGPDDDNCIDAWWLRQMGLYAAEALPTDYDAVAHTVDCVTVAHTAYRDEAVSKVAWPVLAARAAS